MLGFFAENRSDWLYFLMLVITYSGSYVVVTGLTIVSAVSFYFHRHISRILPLFLSVGGSAATVFILKNIFARSRPPIEAFYIEESFSFPSGHAALAMALYGFFIYSIWRHDKHHLKNSLIIFLSLLILLVGLSRLYLGVHYLSDVLVGYAIGLLWIWLARSISRSKIWRLPDSARP